MLIVSIGAAAPSVKGAVCHHTMRWKRKLTCMYRVGLGHLRRRRRLWLDAATEPLAQGDCGFACDARAGEGLWASYTGHRTSQQSEWRGAQEFGLTLADSTKEGGARAQPRHEGRFVGA